jgi:PAS domain S-box-containing protein
MIAYDDELHRENESLRQRNAELVQRALDAEQALEAARGEVDAAAPVLLLAAQDEAEEALRRNEALFRAVIEKSAEVISLTASDGATRYLTPSVWSLLGWTPEEMGNRPLHDHVVLEDRARIATELERLATTGVRDMAMEFRVKHRDGSILWLECSTTNLLGDQNVQAIVGNYRDITSRKHAEEALRLSRDQLEVAQAIAHVGSWSSGLGSDDEIVWSSECYRIFGVPSETAITVGSFFACVHPDDRERVQRMSRDAMEGVALYDVVHRVVRPDGSVRLVEERAVVERDAAGQQTRMVGVVQDVTDRARAIEALRASEAEFRLLAEAMPQIVWITRADGACMYLNQRWMDYTGLTLEESLGDRWTTPFHPDDEPIAWEAWEHATATLGTYSVECRLRRGDGTYGWWLIRGVPIQDAGGTIIKWFGTCTDIDAMKQGVAALR